MHQHDSCCQLLSQVRSKLSLFWEQWIRTYQEYGGRGENSLLPTAKRVKVWDSHHQRAKAVVRSGGRCPAAPGATSSSPAMPGEGRGGGTGWEYGAGNHCLSLLYLLSFFISTLPTFLILYFYIVFQERILSRQGCSHLTSL